MTSRADEPAPMGRSRRSRCRSRCAPRPSVESAQVRAGAVLRGGLRGRARAAARRRAARAARRRAATGRTDVRPAPHDVAARPRRPSRAARSPRAVPTLADRGGRRTLHVAAQPRACAARGRPRRIGPRPGVVTSATSPPRPSREPTSAPASVARRRCPCPSTWSRRSPSASSPRSPRRSIREIAWEVIPDLAEALIKKEIDRLKAELQQT